MLYMFLGQKSLRIIMVMFNCIFGKYKNESEGIPPPVPCCSFVPLPFATCSHVVQLRMMCCHVLRTWEYIVHLVMGILSSCKANVCPSCCLYPFILFMSNFLDMLSHDKRGYPFSLEFTSCHIPSSFCIFETCQVSTLVDTSPSPESR